MPIASRSSLVIGSIALLLTAAPAAEVRGQLVGSEAHRSTITIMSLDSSSKQVVLDAPRRYAAPNWSPDGSYLLLNSGGKLWRLPIKGGGQPEPISTGSAGWIDINHGISPDGKRLAITSGPIFLLPGSGGEPKRVTAGTPSYFHGWSPDGSTLAYAANRGSGFDVYAIGVGGGVERRLTTNPAADDSPAYSPDGRWIYFDSSRSGNRNIWRIPADGAGPGDSKAERITSIDREDRTPRPSPDGKWLIFLSYPRKTGGNLMDHDVMIRRMPLPGDRVVPGKVEDVARIVGGHGSIGSRPWSPDGKSFAYASFEAPPPTIRVIFFTPSDIKVPDGVPHRLTRIADATERFLFDGMRRWKYPSSVDRLFRRERDGSLEILQVKGNQPFASGFYAKPTCASEAIEKAKQQYRIAGEGHIWWIFLYVGDRPTRFGDWRGIGSPRDGGWAIVNYDTIPGEIRPDLSLGTGFNSEYFLKGTIHELGHAFGLHHTGPNLSLGLGNSLMGANNSVYAARKYPNADQVYLTESSAAMLWKHPIFSGSSKDRALQPSVKLVGYKPSYSRANNRVTLSGKLVSDMPAHSVVVLDDLGRPDDEYWNRSHTARIAPDGTFQVAIDNPAKADGHYQILFCFENGMVTGDGDGVVFDDRGAIKKSYRVRNGTYSFGD
jgi:WD40-like Beta Propeller Repeat